MRASPAWPFSWRAEEAGHAAGFPFVERHGTFGDAALVPDAEADVGIVRQVAGHT